MRGLFITLEGGEGVGKSTQLIWLQEQLLQMGLTVRSTREPGGSNLGQKLRDIVLNDPMAPSTELLIYLADRMQHVHEKLSPWVQEKQVILCDRFIDSSEVYQGVSRGLGQQLVRQLHELLLPANLWPKLTILLDMPPEEGLKRVNLRANKNDRLENELIDFHQKVRQGFLDQAAGESERIKIVNALGSLPEVNSRVWQEALPVVQAWQREA